MSATNTVTGASEEPEDIRPVVARQSAGNAGLYAFGAILLLGGIGLFAMMSANRAALTAPRTTAVAPQAGERITSPPPLALPDGGYSDYPERWRMLPRPGAQPRNAPPPPAVQYAPAPVRQAPVAPFPDYSDVPARVGLPRPATVFEGRRESLPAPAQAAAGASGGAERVSAGRLASPAFTVPKGTVIPAVLETALDSTRPGAARALVQRDVAGFDGSRTLIPRGSRLHGEYESDLASGQNRALIRWTRLIRPDGVTVALDSPSSDPLGRAGVKGKVDSKFFQRFGGAILQSVLDIGVGVATREATGGVVVALPGSTQTIQAVQPQQIQPTLKVRHGTSVSVFVARDLDFSSVDR